MGRYTDRLAARLREGGNGRKRDRLPRQVANRQKDIPGDERLVAVAIIRDGVLHSRGFKSHGELRSALGDDAPYEQRHRPADQEGFLTSTGRYANRREAVQIANASGQCHGRVGELLSSDIDW